MCVVITFKTYSRNTFKVYNTVLLIIVTLLYIRSPELFFIYDWKFVPFDQHLPIFPPHTQASGHGHSTLFFLSL